MVPAIFLDPNIAFVLLVFGLLAISWELHAPGFFVPGLLGLLMLAVGAFSLSQDSPSWPGVLLLVAAVLLLGIEFKYYTHMISGIAGTILLAFGALVLVQGPRRISPAIALAISLAFGVITIFLGFLGMRARKNKSAVGTQTLVGQIGIAQTALDPDGTIFVRGEYWQAHSGNTIAAGQRVCIRGVEDLKLYVEAA